MTWNEFINKIKEFRKQTGKSPLNAPPMIKLLYGGAFDEMLSPEARKIPAILRYEGLTKELLDAMGSKASIPKKTKTEIIGLDQVRGMGHLMLWRYSSNPFIQYDLTDYSITFLKSLGYERPKMQEGDITWTRPATDARGRTDILYSWHNIFSRPPVLRCYESGQRNLAVMGIVVKAEKKIYQGHKESLAVVLFNGHEYTCEMRMWPGEDGKLNKGILAQMEVGSTGLAMVRPKVWNDKPSAAIISWMPLLGTA